MSVRLTTQNTIELRATKSPMVVITEFKGMGKLHISATSAQTPHKALEALRHLLDQLTKQLDEAEILLHLEDE